MSLDFWATLFSLFRQLEGAGHAWRRLTDAQNRFTSLIPMGGHGQTTPIYPPGPEGSGWSCKPFLGVQTRGVPWAKPKQKLQELGRVEATSCLSSFETPHFLDEMRLAYDARRKNQRLLRDPGSFQCPRSSRSSRFERLEEVGTTCFL